MLMIDCKLIYCISEDNSNKNHNEREKTMSYCRRVFLFLILRENNVLTIQWQTANDTAKNKNSCAYITWRYVSCAIHDRNEWLTFVSTCDQHRIADEFHFETVQASIRNRTLLIVVQYRSLCVENAWWNSTIQWRTRIFFLLLLHKHKSSYRFVSLSNTHIDGTVVSSCSLIIHMKLSSASSSFVFKITINNVHIDLRLASIDETSKDTPAYG
jgi:hypothetical protein